MADAEIQGDTFRILMNRAFTLIELMVVIAIMGVMSTVAVISFTSSKGSISEFAAARDVMSMIRRARSEALITQKPVVLTYENASNGEEGITAAKITIKSEKLFNSSKESGRVQTLDGKYLDEMKGAINAEVSKDDGAAYDSGEVGETLEDALSPEAIPPDVLEGMRIKALDISQELDFTPTYKSQISIFSTADNVSRTLNINAGKDVGESGDESDKATDAPLSVTFSANGTVNPAHRIWLYRDGTKAEDGVCISVDRFGEPKCEELE